MTRGKDREQFLQDLGPIQSHASRCIRCGFCNAACPTSNVTSAFKDSRTSRGRMILIQSLVEDLGNIDPYSADFKNLIDLCYNCRRCIPACPAGIPIPDLMSHARYAYLKRKGLFGLSLGHRIYGNYGAFDRLGSAVTPISNWMLKRRFVRQLVEWATHIDSRAYLPTFQAESFQSWFRKRPRTPRAEKLVYFVDSYANYNEPSIGKTVATLLDRLGYEIILPPQKEAGMPALEYGMLEKAMKLARYNLAHLAPYARQGMRIVCSSPAATYLLKYGYGTILEDHDFPLVSKAVVDIAELLLQEYNKENLRFSSKTPRHVQYHYCCLSKALSLAPVTTRLLEAAGIEYSIIEDCCGGAGVWGTFKENYKISDEIAWKLREKINESVDVLTESETCKLQIQAKTNVTVRFPIEALAELVEKP